MIIPGFVIAWITFPGVIVHEIAHQLFCRFSRVAVLDVCYFRFGNPAGYVVHEIPRRHVQHILIGVGPFLVNSLLGPLIAFPAALPVLKFQAGSPLDYLLIWLGVSITMHAFPSTGDARSIWAAVRSSDVPLVTRLLTFPIVALIYLGALGSFFWLDLIYGILLAMFVPNLLVSLLT